MDNDALRNRSEFLEVLHDSGAWILRGMVGFAALFVTFACIKYKSALERVSSEAHETPIRWSFLSAHLVATAVFVGLSIPLYLGTARGVMVDLLAAGWLFVGLSTIALAAFAVLTPKLWLVILRRTGHVWVYALIASVLACFAGNASRTLWQSASQVTFVLVKEILQPFVSTVVTDPQAMKIGTSRFSVQIAPECSGLEGAGLMLAFGIVWLTLFRRESRFPQALLLIPAGTVLVFLLNAVRIAGLILIGNGGAERIALGGFHSQAGWISFNAVAVAFSVAARRSPWLTKSTPEKGARFNDWADNLTAAYLMPFVAILAVGMVSLALSADFEWLYPLRFVAALCVLWFYRRRYAALDWRFGWFGPAAGVVVFFIWIAPNPSFNSSVGMPIALAAASPILRISWLVLRTLAAVITVPIAEELAFRGFLLRRLISPNFDLLDFRKFTWMALLVSSIAFGVLHGQQWFAGTVAGLFYAVVLIRRGRIGEAVAAHATTNALLAGYVLAFHKWNLW